MTKTIKLCKMTKKKNCLEKVWGGSFLHHTTSVGK